MKGKEFKYSLLLLLTAAIWGFAFVAQRVGSKYVGSFTFNGVRFALGSVSLLPLIMYNSKKSKGKGAKLHISKNAILGGIALGIVLFAASSLQQIGIVETSAGKAAFITGLYIVLVPIFGIFLKQKNHVNTWIGAALAVIGLYFLSVNEGFSIARGDLFEIMGAFLWAVHILLVDHFTKKLDPLRLSFIQFLLCSILSLAAAISFEKITTAGIIGAAIPILYGGILSVGVAYTLQVVGQRYANPSHAAIILSMESVFAGLGGLIILHEDLGTRGYLGCALMFLGVLVSQIENIIKSNVKNNYNSFN